MTKVILPDTFDALEIGTHFIVNHDSHNTIMQNGVN